ncbi:MAG: histidine phosphatase family protein [Planctomycetota bacterium]
MVLSIIRHAQADDPTPGGSDHARRLTKKGRRQAEWLADALASSDAPPTMVLSSTRLRALETAEPIAAALGREVTESETLARFEPAEVAVGVIEEHPEIESLAIVGHNPQFSELVWMLIGELGSEPGSLKKGECVRLEIDPFASIVGALPIARLRMPKA